MRRWLVWMAVLAALGAGISAAAPIQSPAALFRIDGQKPQRVIIARGEEIDHRYPLKTTMGRALAGVDRVLTPVQIGQLLRCPSRLAPTAAENHRDVFVIHLSLDERTKRIKVTRDPAGRWFGREMGGSGEMVLLRAERFAPLIADVPVYRGGFDDLALEIEPGRQAPLVQPYVASPIHLDQRTLMRRLYRGMRVRIAGADRNLEEERFHVRVPRDYDPRAPAGLLVWSSPAPDGRIPPMFAAALDEWNMVCVGVDNAGNERDTPDRLQLHFDALTNAMIRFHVDPRRVYVVGLSGGGKISSILGICFPEVFFGSIPIVGLATHHQLDASFGRHVPPYFSPPAPGTLTLARKRPMAVMTGPPDFNYHEMKVRYDLLIRNGFARVRFFEYAEMGHQMPTAEHFADALRFIDEPYQQMRAMEVEQTEAAWTSFLAEHEGAAALSESERRELERIMEMAPWSEPAWEALELFLGSTDATHPNNVS